MLRQAKFAFVCVCVCACTSIPITSLPKVAGVRPDTADFMQFEIAIRTSEDFRLYKDGVWLTLEIVSEEGTGQAPERLRLPFVPVRGEIPRFLEREQKRGTQIVRLRVASEIADAAEAFRAEAIRRRREYPKQNALTMSAQTDGCLREGVNPFQSLKMKTYLRRSSDEAFFVLFKERAVPFGEESGGVSYCQIADDARALMD